MTDRNIARWLLVALAIVGLAFAAPAVSAHGDEPVRENETATDGTPVDGETATWATWMEAHMTDQMGPNAVDQMETFTGVTVDEMAREMADGDHGNYAAAGRGGGMYGC